MDKGTQVYYNIQKSHVTINQTYEHFSRMSCMVTRVAKTSPLNMEVTLLVSLNELKYNHNYRAL